MEKIRPVFSFRSIELIDQHILQQPKETVGPKFTFKLTLTSRTIDAEKLLMVFVAAEIFDDNESMKFATITVACIFNIENFDILPKTENQFHIELIDFSTLNAISISTVRGVIWSILKGTYLHNAILPVFNIDDLKLQSPE